MTLYDPERRWIVRASCRTVDPERFFTTGPMAVSKPPTFATQQAWNEAKKICSFCPVLAECRRDTLGEEYGVWGGRDEHQRSLIRNRLSRTARKWPEERRLAWGKALHALQQQGVNWTRIRAMTGFGSVLGTKLIHEHLKAGRPQARPSAVRSWTCRSPSRRSRTFPVCRATGTRGCATTISSPTLTTGARRPTAAGFTSRSRPGAASHRSARAAGLTQADIAHMIGVKSSSAIAVKAAKGAKILEGRKKP
ncbi:WhiB family transcriptional regulator [Streptomyces sp. NPDC002018]|uniref:WhiB family transcriptional regulator n=1 Tax=Streptomyces sp. NPDC002018 TaxID=3364629 RepID=UPI00368C2999